MLNRDTKVSLGIHVGHDRGAAVIVDGEVAAMLAQERLDRIKYSQSSIIPFECIDAVLAQVDLSIEDVSCVGISFVATDGERLLDIYKREFFEHYDCSYVPFYWVGHHDAHAYAAFYSSGFSESLVFVADGGGDFVGDKQESETLYVGRNGSIVKVDRRLQDLCIRNMRDPLNHIYPFMPSSIQNLQLSLGRKYAQFTHLLGFRFGEAGKTMGLASYGESLFDFSDVQYSNLNFSLTYSDMIKDLFVMQELSGLSYKQYLQQERESIAHTVQSFTEQALLSLTKNFARTYRMQNICLVGGIFLNCLTNHKIIEQSGIENVYILPCSGDDGQSLGSAFYAYVHQFGNPEHGFAIRLPYLGLSYSDEAIEKELRDRCIAFEKYEDDDALAETVARIISDNRILALHRGRTEVGPRALCHRSILANPSNPRMKDILNERVKHREPFRPFAPTVTWEDQFAFFDLQAPSEYMLLATTVKEPFRSDLASITHVDGTARVQAISSDSEPFMHSLLRYMEKITGYPIVLNTSFNVAGEPIVESPQDAVNTFLSTEIDVLVIGKYLVDKRRHF